MFALFCRIKVQGKFRKWQFAGLESDYDKVNKFRTECEEENGLDSTRVFDMNSKDE